MESCIEPLESRIAPAIMYGIDARAHLISFNSAAPAILNADLPLVGIGQGEMVEEIDFRPRTGGLYALTSDDQQTGRLYEIDLATAQATLVTVLAPDPRDTSKPFVALEGESFGVDFDPTIDRLRVISDTGLNLRIDADTGQVTTLKRLDATQSGFTAIAYGNNFDGVSTTQLWRVTGTMTSPPDGGARSSNNLQLYPDRFGYRMQGLGGFDIKAVGHAYAALLVETGTTFFAIADDGEAGFIGKIGSGEIELRGLASAPPVSGPEFVFTDVDGDVVEVKASKGDFKYADIALDPAGNVGGAQLSLLHLAYDGPGSFANADLTITATPGPLGGDGLVNVGFIDASKGHFPDRSKVKVDLGIVSVDGDLGRIDVGDRDLADGSMTSLTVESMGAFGTSTQRDRIANLFSTCNGRVSAINVNGDIVGAEIGVNGSRADRADTLHTFSLGGSLIGGGIGVGEGVLGNATVGGSVFDDDRNASISAGVIRSLVVHGDMVGGSLFQVRRGNHPAVAFDHILIEGDFVGSSILGQRGPIADVTIQGDVLSTDENPSRIRTNGTIGTIHIGGDVIGMPGSEITISAGGFPYPGTQEAARLIGKITIDGSAEFLDILAGYLIFTDKRQPTLWDHPDASIGQVIVAKNWLASNIVAGVAAPNGRFGDAEISLLNAQYRNNANIIARIGSVVIGGEARGTEGGDDSFGIVAERIGKLTVGATVYALDPARLDAVEIGVTGDFWLREVRHAP